MGNILTIPRVKIKPRYLRIIGLTSAITACRVVFGAICLSDNYGSTLWWKAGRSASINSIGDTVTFHGPWSRAYGSQLIKKGIHQWRLKIMKEGDNIWTPNCWIGLAPGGLASSIAKLNHALHRRDDDGGKFYAYQCQGGLYDHKLYPRGKIAEYNGGDIVAMKVDFESDTIAFAINNGSFQTAWSSIDSDSYRLAVSSGDKGTTIQILSYENLTFTESAYASNSNRITWTYNKIMFVGVVLALCGGILYIKMQKKQPKQTNIDQNDEEMDQDENAELVNEDVDEEKEEDSFILHGEDQHHKVEEQCQLRDDFKAQITRPEEKKEAHVNLSESQSQFKHWIFNVVEKGEYYELFCDKGYDDIRILHLFTDELLNDIGIKKVGHRAIICQESHKYVHHHQEGNTAY
eukprot:317788_1